MHFSFDVSLGQIFTIMSILAIGFKGLSQLRHVEKRIDRFMWEHDLLWNEYARTHSLPNYREEQ